MTGAVSCIHQNTWVTALMNTQIPNCHAYSELQRSVVRIGLTLSAQGLANAFFFLRGLTRLEKLLSVPTPGLPDPWIQIKVLLGAPASGTTRAIRRP